MNYKSFCQNIVDNDVHIDITYPGRYLFSNDLGRLLNSLEKRYIQTYDIQYILDLISQSKQKICIWCEEYVESRGIVETITKVIGNHPAFSQISFVEVQFNCSDELVDAALYWSNLYKKIQGNYTLLFYDSVAPSLQKVFKDISFGSISSPLFNTKFELQKKQTKVLLAIEIADLSGINFAPFSKEVDMEFKEQTIYRKLTDKMMNKLIEKECSRTYDNKLGSQKLKESLSSICNLYMARQSVQRVKQFKALSRDLGEQMITLSKGLKRLGMNNVQIGNRETKRHLFENCLYLDPGSHGIESKFIYRALEAFDFKSIPLPIYPIKNLSYYPYYSIIGITKDGDKINYLKELLNLSENNYDYKFMNEFIQCQKFVVQIRPDKRFIDTLNQMIS